MPPSMVASNNNAEHSSAAPASPESHPPSLLCSTSSSTPHSEYNTGAQTQEQAGGDHPHHPHHPLQQLATEQQHATQPAVVCDDASYFDGDWVSNTVQSAVTHFFGNDGAAPDDRDLESQTALASASIQGDEEDDDEELDISNGLLSPATAASAAGSVVACGGANENATAETAGSIVTYPTIDTAAHNQPLPLLSKARSLSPSFSLFASNAGCAAGIYNHLQCDNHSAAGDDNSLRTNGNRSAATPSAADYRPHFSPADFTPQTWTNVLRDTSTIRYCGAGAAVLTAVIVIHPLALIGAVTTAAVSATAMWAVGFFHDLDKGYQIWSEEFGMLFWEDNDESNDGASVVDAQGGALGLTGSGVAATVTSESHQIIQKDEEHLRRVFLLEQERRKMGEKVRVVKVEESTGKLQEVTNETTEEEEGAEERGDVIREELNWTASSKSSKEGVARLQRPPSQQPPKKGYGMRRIKSAPVKSKSSNNSNSSQLLPLEKPPTMPGKPKIKRKPKSTSSAHPLSHDVPSFSTTTELIDSHFPPLEICVVRRVELPGLNTAEFFKVFFADDAPYSMRDFQKKRGDVDILYSKWEHCVDEREDDNGRGSFGCLYSLKKCEGVNDPTPLPPNSTQERKLKFNTLTKSYFGPAYAKAIKTQRVTQLSSNILVIEHVTQLMDIPFSDRFRVIERWVVEAVKNDSPKQTTTVVTDGDDSSSHQRDGMDEALYTCKLSVHAEVDMLKNCSWEAQIRKKASETFTEVATEWCKSATVALRATEEQKRKRLRLDKINNTDRNDTTGNASNSRSTARVRLPQPRPPPATPSARESELFAKHRRNFQELDKLIANGDLEWCSIEVMHSSSSRAGDGQQSALFAQVLEYPLMTEISSSMTGSTTDDDGEMMMDGVRRKGPTLIMRRKSRKLFKRLSSRVSKSKQQQPR